MNVKAWPWSWGTLVLLGLLAGGCAHPEAASPCRDVPVEPPPGSPWAARTQARHDAYVVFYGRALRGIDGLTAEDAYTFIRQGALGGVPVLAGDDGARAFLMSRFDGAHEAVGDALWTPLDPEDVLGRFHLARYRQAELPFDALLKAAEATTSKLKRDTTELDWRVCTVKEMVNRGELPLTRKDWPDVASLWESGAPPGHSVSFRHYQQPAYVVLLKEDAIPLLKAVEAAEGR